MVKFNRIIIPLNLWLLQSRIAHALTLTLIFRSIQGNPNTPGPYEKGELKPMKNIMCIKICKSGLYLPL
jgi:hypothetical protein